MTRNFPVLPGTTQQGAVIQAPGPTSARVTSRPVRLTPLLLPRFPRTPLSQEPTARTRPRPPGHQNSMQAASTPRRQGLPAEVLRQLTAQSSPYQAGYRLRRVSGATRRLAPLL